MDERPADWSWIDGQQFIELLSYELSKGQPILHQRSDGLSYERSDGGATHYQKNEKREQQSGQS